MIDNTVGKVLLDICQLLKDTDADSAESCWIVCSVLGVNRNGLDKSFVLSQGQMQDILTIINMRRKRLPLDYILGYSNFYGLKIAVNDHVLIPRMETELLVELAIKTINSSKNKCKVLDLCTGSGCIAIAIGASVGYKVHLTLADIDTNALQIAKQNATNILQDKCEWCVLQSDLFDNIGGKFDIIVSNPPYIVQTQILQLSNEVKAQPHIALDGGLDGLDFYRRITQQAKKYLQSNGTLLLEIGHTQSKAVCELAYSNGFGGVEVIRDYDGNDRIVVAKQN